MSGAYTLLAGRATGRCLDGNANGAVYTLRDEPSNQLRWRNEGAQLIN